MTKKRRKQIAVVMFVVPLIVGAGMQLSGSDSFVIEWEGALSSPKSTSIEFHDFGAVLIITSLIGFLWLAYLVIRSWFSPKLHDDQTA